MYSLYQEVHYEDDKLSVIGYVSSLNDKELTLHFDPFTVVCQEGVLYKGDGELVCRAYDEDVFATIQKVCTGPERQAIEAKRVMYKKHVTICIAVAKLYDKLTDRTFIREKDIKHILSEEYYLVPADSAKSILTTIFNQLLTDIYSLRELARISKLSSKEIKELMNDAKNTISG